jgi:penicillin amidase
MLRGLLVFVFALGLLALAPGCGDDDDDSGDDDNDSGDDDAERDALLGHDVDVTVPLPGLSQPARVALDGYGIPYLFAADSRDLAMVLGYVQASNRFFQMDLLRHFAEGRLTEWFGASALDTDLYYRVAFMTQEGTPVIDEIAAALPAEVADLIQAFADGINVWLHERQAAGVDDQWPHDYSFPFLNMNPGQVPDWTVRDTVAIARYQTWDLSNSLRDEMRDTASMAALSGDLYDLLYTKQPATDAVILPPDAKSAPSAPRPSASGAFGRFLDPATGRFKYAAALRAIEEAEAFAPHLGNLRASNNWTYSASINDGTGYVANDPHLDLSSPSVFMLGLIDSSVLGDEDLRSWGTLFPGTNAVVIGANRNVAWGETVCGYDVQDVYEEELVLDGGTPAAVKFEGGEVELIVSNQEFIVGQAGTETQTVPVYVVPHHGPILPDSIEGTSALSHRWTGGEATTELKAFLDLNRATNVATGRAALDYFEVGGQNFVLQDTAGDMAYYPHAWVPTRDGDFSTEKPWLILPGGGDFEWNGRLTNEELPQAENPGRGWLGTSNNDIDGSLQDGDPLTPGPYLHADRDLGYRGQRIHEGLADMAEGTIPATADAMKALQTDSQANYARDLVTSTLDELGSDLAGLSDDAQTAVALWQGWDFVLSTGLSTPDPESDPVTDQTELDRAVSGMVFGQYELRLKQAVYGDELAAEAASFDYGRDSASVAIARLMNGSSDSPLADAIWDDVSTVGPTETRRDCIVAALNRAVSDLAAMDGFAGLPLSGWLWGRKHNLVLYHPAFGDYGDLDPLLNLGPYATTGGLHTVNVANYGYDAGTDSMTFVVTSGAALRSVHEIKDGTVTSWMTIPGGTSGYQDSPHRTDLLDLWLAHEYYQMPTEVTDILAATETMIAFEP